MEDDKFDDNFAKLLEMVNEKEEIGEEFTEEELKQVFSPQQQIELEDYEEMECDASKKNDEKEKQNLSQHYSFEMMNHHIFKGKHGKKFYKCDVCDGVYRHSFSLKRHFIRTHINYAYLSEVDVTNCGINLSSSASLQTWCKNFQKDPISKLKNYYFCCHSCITFFSNISEIRNHVDNLHRSVLSNQSNMKIIQSHDLMRHVFLSHKSNDNLFEEWNQDAVKNCSTDLKIISSINQLKSFNCDVCLFSCSSYINLCSHFAHRHKNFYNPCAFCDQFYKSKKELMSHLRLVHSKSYNANAKQLRLKEQVSLSSCSSSPSSFTSSTSPHVVQVLSMNEVNSESKLKSKSFNKSSNFKESLDTLNYKSCSQIKPLSKVFNYSTKTTDSTKFNSQRESNLKRCQSIGSSLTKKHNSDELTNLEINFYRFLAQNISENLLFYVDGKIKPREKSLNADAKDLASPALNLTQYNIPLDFYSKEDEEDNKIDFLLDCKLKSCQSNRLNKFNLKKTYDSSNSYKLYICDVCDESLTSCKAFDDHELNNHPNVSCTFLEIDISCNIPAYLLNFKNNSPRGLLKKCKVPYLDHCLKNGHSIKCTKCSKCFSNSSLLHQHILDCASSSESSALPLLNVSSIQVPSCNLPFSDSSKSFKSTGYNTRSSKRRKILPILEKNEVEPKLDKSSNDFILFDGHSSVASKDSFFKDNNNNNYDLEMMAIDKVDLKTNKPKSTKYIKNYLYMVTLKKRQSCSKQILIGNRRRCFKSLLNKPVIRKKGSKIKKNVQRFKSLKKFEKKSLKEIEKIIENKIQKGQEEKNFFSCEKDKRSFNDSKLAKNKNERRCPNCVRVFKYLGNFKKHIKAGCPSKNHVEDLTDDEIKVTETFNGKVLNKNEFEKKIQTGTSENKFLKEEIKSEKSKQIFKNEDNENENGKKEKNGELNDFKNKRKLDLWTVKQKYPLYAFKGSPAQHHSCPYCRRGFTYLANFRRHTHADCPIINQGAALKKQPSIDQNSQNNFQISIPQEHCIEKVNLVDSKDNQTTIKSKNLIKNEIYKEKNEFLKISEDGIETKSKKLNSNLLRFKTFSCNICHKIYFSYLQMLRHRLSHKLSGKLNFSNSETLTNQKQEEELAKKVLKGQEKELKLNSKFTKNLDCNSIECKSSIKMPISNLLENLARGGILEKENDDEGNLKILNE